MAPVASGGTAGINGTAGVANNSTADIADQALLWLKTVPEEPTKVILIASVVFHVIVFVCLFVICCKYRRLQRKFKKLRSDFKTELDDYQKKETTNLTNSYNQKQNGTRPGTTSTSGIFFDECLADQKLLSNPPHAQKRLTSVQSSTATIQVAEDEITAQNTNTALAAQEDSTPPTPLPRSKSKGDFSLPPPHPNNNSSNNNHLSARTPPTSRTSEVQQFSLNSSLANQDSREPPEEDDENPLEKSGSWFIPITPATKRNPKLGRLHQTVVHTPTTQRTKESIAAGENDNNNNTPIGTSRALFEVLEHGDSPIKGGKQIPGSPNSQGEMNPLSQLTLWEQHERKPVLKYKS